MSMYGDDDKGRQKNDLYDDIRDFLQDNPISELIKVVADVIKDYMED